MAFKYLGFVHDTEKLTFLKLVKDKVIFQTKQISKNHPDIAFEATVTRFKNDEAECNQIMFVTTPYDYWANKISIDKRR